MQDRLRKLREGKTSRPGAMGKASQAKSVEGLRPLLQMAREKGIGEDELGRALVRNLLDEAFGAELVGALEFQAVADRVCQIIANSVEGRRLIDDAIWDLTI
ncbi:MAG TPA: hypothetical protein VJM34_11120 [Novosphingobium sp.]|nr:hypothetical protein [Novosphingobium sp.]